MTSLRQTQGDFQAYVLRGQRRIRGQIVGTELADARRRLDVYGEAYRLRLIEALEQDFPGLVGLLGQRKFRSLAEGYIEAFPSPNPSLRWFGANLARYLRSAPSTAKRLKWSEMAQFEWLKGEAFDAADGPQASIEDVCAVPLAAWPDLRLRFHPSVHRIDFQFNVPSLWRAIVDNDEVPAVARSDVPVPWVIWRSNLGVNWRSLEKDEAQIMDAARAGVHFAALCEILCDGLRDDTRVATRAATILKQWVNDEMIDAVETVPTF